MTSTLPPLTQALTGALGSASANVLTYPLDLLVARQQTTRDARIARSGLTGTRRLARAVLRRDGWRALYAGIGADTAGTLLSNFCYFYAYSLLRALLLRRRARAAVGHASGSAAAAKAQLLPVPVELALGFLAGIAGRAVSTPLNVLTVRLQTSSDTSDDDSEDDFTAVDAPPASRTPLALVRAIYASDGVAGFWKGFPLAALLSLNPALSFALFQLFRRLLALSARGSRAAPSPRPGPLESFAGAALANALASAALYPLILAKTQLQAARSNAAQADEKGAAKPALTDALRGAQRFPGGRYQALQAQLLKAFVSQGVAFLVKERIERVLLLVLARKNAAKV